ncbi:hypothetical protein B4091_2097 [Bacillus licheniformis]|nr:hypothetical protein B4091_2097 [Bacillus licheniformis]
MVKEWGNQEQVLDELTEGYFEFKRDIAATLTNIFLGV